MNKLFFLVLMLICTVIAKGQYVLTIDDVEFNTSIGRITNYNNTTEKDIIIPDDFNGVHVKSIGQSAFMNKSLERVTIPNTVTLIKAWAFNKNLLKSITIPCSVIEIESYAFYENSITEVIIPDRVTIIGGGAFKDNSLSSVTIGSSVIDIWGSAFENNLLESISIPNTVESIGNYAFYNNRLTSVIIPNSVTTLGQESFASNDLSSVIIGNSVTEIKSYTFRSNKLTSVRIPNSVTSIGDYAFQGNSLTSVTIGNSVNTIGKYAFYGTLINIDLPSDVIGYANEVWKDSDEAIVIKVSDFSKSYYVEGDKVYIVRFEDYNGTLLKSESVDYSSAAIAPASPTRTGYTFTGWDVNFDHITTALTVTAQYAINNYSVRFEDWDQAELKTEMVDHGLSATAPASPTRTGYTFTGWDLNFDDIIANITVRAEYDIVTSIPDLEMETLNMYPNPASHHFTIDGAEGQTLSIYNMSGKLVLQMTNIDKSQIVHVNRFSKGIYVVKVGIEAKRIVIQ